MTYLLNFVRIEVEVVEVIVFWRNCGRTKILPDNKCGHQIKLFHGQLYNIGKQCIVHVFRYKYLLNNWSNNQLPGKLEGKGIANSVNCDGFLFWRSKPESESNQYVAFIATERVLQEELRAEKVAGESFKASRFHRHTRSAWKTKTWTANDWFRTKSHITAKMEKY